MEFNIISSTLNTSYKYKDVIIVQGSYIKDAKNENLQSINGQCFRKNAQGEQGDLIGNFNGSRQPNGTINYDLTSMSRADSNLVWDAIDDIQAEVLPVDD